jgi:uncharacterized RDD family membrane protein YckC
MPWYYVDNGQRNGPKEESDFQLLINTGAIGAETLVWREGMANWRAYKDVIGGATLDSTFGASPSLRDGYCSQCGKPFPSSDMLCYEGAYVCATCKPSFFQKLREGAHLSTAMRYAGFKIRAGAKLIDSIIIWAIQGTLSLIIGALLVRTRSTSAAVGGQVLIVFAQLLVGASYTCWFLVKFGATPGKMACRLKVVMPDGGPISFGRSLGRYFADMLSGMILGIGYVMAAFDEEKRALHDRICDTRVVRT